MNRLARFCLVSLFFFSLVGVSSVSAYPANVNVVFIDQVMRWSPEVGEPWANHTTIHLVANLPDVISNRTLGWSSESGCDTKWVALPDGDTQMVTAALNAMTKKQPVVIYIVNRAVSYTTVCWVVGINVFP